MYTILILEDNNVELNKLIVLANEVNPHITILSAGTGKQALSLAKKNSVDAFFLDMQLPDISGLEVALSLRAMPQYKTTHIAFITADASQEVIAYRNTHCFYYIIKSFDKDPVKRAFITLFGQPKSDDNNKLVLHFKNHTTTVRFNDIIYIEYSKRTSHIVTARETIHNRNKLSQLLALLPPYFIRIGQSHIVNTKQISHVDYGTATIKLGQYEVNISRAYKKRVREQLDELL